MDCSDTISVESIQDPGNDIGKSCYQYNSMLFLYDHPHSIQEHNLHFSETSH